MSLLKTHAFATKHFLFILLFVLSAIFLFKGLDHTLLWQDEAHNAILSSHINQYGFPKVWDGKNLITGMNGLDFDEDFMLSWDGLFPYYFTAPFISILGKTTFAARLPFVLIALLSLWVVYNAILQISLRRDYALFTLFFMATAFIFLLHSRQSRYYSILPLCSSLSFLGLQQTKSKGGILLGAAGLILLYHSNMVSFLMVYLGLALFVLFIGKEKEKFKRLFWISFWCFIFTFPHFFYFQMWKRKDAMGLQEFDDFTFRLFGNIIILNKYYLPCLLLPLVFFLKRKILKFKNEIHNPLFSYSLILIVVSLILTPFFLRSNIRYLYHLLPFSSYLLAWACLNFVGKKRALMTLILLFTHLLDYSPVYTCVQICKYSKPYFSKAFQKDLSSLYSDLSIFDDEEGPPRRLIEQKVQPLGLVQRIIKGEYKSYWNETTQTYPDPLLELIAFLKEHRKKEEKIFLSVGQYPLLYYYPEAELAYSLSEAPESKKIREKLDVDQWNSDAIVWYIPRYFTQVQGPTLKEDQFLLKTIADGKDFLYYELKTPEIYWEGNWPEHVRLYRIKHASISWESLRSSRIYKVVPRND
ncbi:MAG: hypothetical protein HQM15_03820 [Deltaproteobacteria bacterium]|nr:hypothetical protein [Deltaproteobacteria bacterium]